MAPFRVCVVSRTAWHREIGHHAYEMDRSDSVEVRLVLQIFYFVYYISLVAGADGEGGCVIWTKPVDGGLDAGSAVARGWGHSRAIRHHQRYNPGGHYSECA